MREHYRDQRDRLVDTLRRRAGEFLEVEPPDQGMHLVAYLRRSLSDSVVEQAALDEGVVVRAVRTLRARDRDRACCWASAAIPPRRSLPPFGVWRKPCGASPVKWPLKGSWP